MSDAISARSSALPKIEISNGTIEAIKWLALVLMTLDHANKYLLQTMQPEGISFLFNIGRLTLPLFAFVLAYKLSRPLADGAYQRTAKRLAFYGLIASVPFIALNKLAWGWWPLNILITLLVAVTIMAFIEHGSTRSKILAVILFIAGGAVVEFWWPALAICLAAWSYCKKPNWPALAIWVMAVLSLVVINQNYWALASFLIIFSAPYLSFNVPRMRQVFYIFYPAHLLFFWGIMRVF